MLVLVGIVQRKLLYLRMLPGETLYDMVNLEKAVQYVQSNEMSTRKASTVFSVPKSTIGDRTSGTRSMEVGRCRKPALPAQVEEMIALSLKQASLLRVGISRKHLLALTGTLVNVSLPLASTIVAQQRALAVKNKTEKECGKTEH